jgi:hypothetical protein
MFLVEEEENSTDRSQHSYRDHHGQRDDQSKVRRCKWTKKIFGFIKYSETLLSFLSQLSILNDAVDQD